MSRSIIWSAGTKKLLYSKCRQQCLPGQKFLVAIERESLTTFV